MTNLRRTQKVILVFILVSLLVACGTPQTSSNPVPPTAEPIPIPSGSDYWPTTGWRTSTPEEQGMDSEILAEMIEFIQKRNNDNQDNDTHTITVIRNGYIVTDATFYPFDSDTYHAIASCTKSITSTLIGIAFDQGYINDVQQPVLSFFPDRSIANLDANKEKMTLEHLLTMASGLDCSDVDSSMIDMYKSDDWVQFILDLPMAEPPGTRFNYCTTVSFLLSAIIQETTGVNALAFAEEHLFNPLGIDDVIWVSNPQGITFGGNGLLMKPHDMAKIGYLYLNEGRWDDAQIISSDWVDATYTPHLPHSQITYDYGYQWWIRNNKIYYAVGHGRQYIVVIPEHDIVVVFTSNVIPGSVNSQTIYPAYILDFIIEAVQSSTSLPPNPDGLELLNYIIQQAAQDQTEPEPVTPLPEIALTISGQTYTMDPNPLAIQSVSLIFPGEAEALLYFTYNLDELPGVTDKPQDLWTHMDGPVGLDNVFRFSPGIYGITKGMKGAWVSDETFVIYVDKIGGIGRDRYRLSFEGEKLSLEIKEGYILSDGKTTINGRLEE